MEWERRETNNVNCKLRPADGPTTMLHFPSLSIAHVSPFHALDRKKLIENRVQKRKYSALNGMILICDLSFF